MTLPVPIPDPSRIKDPEQRRIMTAIVANLKILCAETGPSEKAHVTRGELQAANVITVKDGQITKASGS